MAETLTVTVDDGGTYTVNVPPGDVALFTDANLTTPGTFPAAIAADTTWYAAAPSGGHPQRRHITVYISAADGTQVVTPPLTQLPATISASEGTVSYSAPSQSGGSSAVAGQGAWYSAVELTLAAGVNNIVFNPEDAQFPSTLDITANEVVAVIGGLDYSTSDASNKVTFILNHMRNSTPTVEADGVVASTRSVSGTDQANNAVPSLEIVVEGPDITGYAWLTVTQFT